MKPEHWVTTRENGTYYNYVRPHENEYAALFARIHENKLITKPGDSKHERSDKM
jgi:hypothetical protein